MFSELKESAVEHTALVTGTMGAGPVGTAFAVVDGIPEYVRASALALVVLAIRYVFRDELRKIRGHKRRSRSGVELHAKTR